MKLRRGRPSTLPDWCVSSDEPSYAIVVHAHRVSGEIRLISAVLGFDTVVLPRNVDAIRLDTAVVPRHDGHRVSSEN